MKVEPDSRFFLFLSLGICFLVGTFSQSGWGTLAGTGFQDAAPSRICVIDLQKVFDSSPQRDELESTLKVAEREKLQVMEGINKEILKLQSEGKLYRPGSSEYDRIQHGLSQKQAEFGFLQKKFDRELTEMLFDARKQVLLSIRDQMKEVCQSRGFDMVIQRAYSP